MNIEQLPRYKQLMITRQDMFNNIVEKYNEISRQIVDFLNSKVYSGDGVEFKFKNNSIIESDIFYRKHCSNDSDRLFKFKFSLEINSDNLDEVITDNLLVFSPCILNDAFVGSYEINSMLFSSYNKSRIGRNNRVKTGIFKNAIMLQEYSSEIEELIFNLFNTEYMEAAKRFSTIEREMQDFKIIFSDAVRKHVFDSTENIIISETNKSGKRIKLKQKIDFNNDNSGFILQVNPNSLHTYKFNHWNFRYLDDIIYSISRKNLKFISK